MTWRIEKSGATSVNWSDVHVSSIKLRPVFFYFIVCGLLITFLAFGVQVALHLRTFLGIEGVDNYLSGFRCASGTSFEDIFGHRRSGRLPFWLSVCKWHFI